MTTPQADHIWNDPDGDGHNCIDCPNDSIWKCDESAHWPDPRKVVEEVQREIAPQLREMALARRRQRTDQILP
jgi:predicted Rdx family selenoprotein